MGTDFVKTGRFTSSEHVKRSNEIKKLFNTGKRVGTEGAKLFYLPNQFGFNRIAFTLPRCYGNAVQRNRSKRLSRETYRYYKSDLKVGYDMIFLIFPGHDSLKKRCEQFRFLCQKAGLLKT